MKVIFRLIDIWSGERTPTWERKPRYTFRGSHNSDTLVLLERELEKLNATELVIQIELSESEIVSTAWRGRTPRLVVLV